MKDRKKSASARAAANKSKAKPPAKNTAAARPVRKAARPPARPRKEERETAAGAAFPEAPASPTAVSAGIHDLRPSPGATPTRAMRTSPSDKKEIMTGVALEDDAAVEPKLRPQTLSQYIGQTKIRENLSVFLEAARGRGEPLDHLLLTGPPGLGKTTLAYIVAREMGAGLRTTSGPMLERKGDLAGILTNFQPRDVLFIDEIHRLNPSVEETLYPAMEDYRLDIVIGEGPMARVFKHDLPPFTLIGATTRPGLLSQPLHARFGISLRLDFYDVEALTLIVERSARILGIPIAADASREIASRSRGTPRIANRLLRRLRDFAEVAGGSSIDLATAREALRRLEVDEHGFDELDRRILSTIIKKFGGGPVGIASIAASIGEDRGTVEDLYEPYLIQAGFLQRTPRGRIASPVAYKHLGIEQPGRGSPRTEVPSQKTLNYE